MKVKTRRDVYYFPSYSAARSYASRYEFPLDRIFSFGIGWAVQIRECGAYAGPRTGPNPI